MSNAQIGGNARNVLLWGTISVLLIIGFVYGVWALIQKHTVDKVSQTSVIGAASSEEQSAAESTLNTFIADVRRHAYDQALKLTSSIYPSPHNAFTLTALAKTKLAPLVTGNNLRFEPAHLGSHGQKLLLRAEMRIGNQPYRTVCTLNRLGGAWLISDILPPVPPGARGVAHIGVAASSSGTPTGGKK